MDRIKQVYQSLSKSEIRYLKSYLTAFHNKGKNKSLELIKVLDKNPNISQDEISEKLYGDPKSKAFIMLKRRLLEKMLETLSLSINFRNNPTFTSDPIASGVLELMKDMSYGIILKRRGLETLAKEILEKCVKNAKRLNVPEYKVISYMHLQNMLISEKRLEEYRLEIKNGLKEFELDVQAGCIMDEWRVMITNRTSKDSRSSDLLNRKLPELESQFGSCYSPRAYYSYLSLKTKLLIYKNNYTKNKELFDEMIKTLDTHIGLQTRSRKGGLYAQIARFEMLFGQFEKARKAAENGMEAFYPQTKNFLSALVYRIFACIYLGNFDEIHLLLSQIDDWIRRTPEIDHVKIIKYLQSCLAYVEGDVKSAKHFLEETKELFSDKGGWNMGLRIYEIFILIDQKLFDVASSKIETLRKHIARYDTDERTVLIYKYLYLLDKNSFLFDVETDSQINILHKLHTRDPWRPMSHEVVKFEVWLKAKKENKAFYPLLKEEIQTIFDCKEL